MKKMLTLMLAEDFLAKDRTNKTTETDDELSSTERSIREKGINQFR